MKREGRIHKGVSIGAYSILIAFMLLLLWTVLRYPGNHLIPWQMALGVAAATVYGVDMSGRSYWPAVTRVEISSGSEV